MAAGFRVWCVATIFGLGCAAEVDAPPRDRELVEPVDVKRSEVVGGKEVSTCDWPSTVRVMGSSQCTGTLIHPRVVTTAAHCLGGSSARIAFGGPRESTSFSVMASCRAGARGSRGVSGGSDWAYCVLPEDPRIAALPITPPLVGCEAERFLKPGARAWVVGYGTTGPRNTGGGIKREVEVMVNSVDRPRGTIDVGDANVGACHGDSGGPLYLHLIDAQGNDYGYRVIGSTSGPGARNCDCTCSTSYVNIANHVAELERNEGIDVTPCTDADGAWDPGPDCAAFPSALKRASGTFPQCSVPRTSSPIQTCGENRGDSEVDGGVTTDAGGEDAGVAFDAGARDAGEAPTPGDAGGSPDAARAADASAGARGDASAARDDEDYADEREDEADEEMPAEDESEDERQDDGEDEREDEEEHTLYSRDDGCAVRSRGAAGEAWSWLLALAALGYVMRRRSPR